MSYEDCFDDPRHAGRLRGARANLIGSEPHAAEIPSAMEMNVNDAALYTTRTSVFRVGAHWIAPDTNEIDGSRTAADITTGNVKAGGSAKIHAPSLKTKDITAAHDVEITDGRGGTTPKA